MGSLVNSLKKFLSNKNTVTILGVILGVIVLYVGYNYRVNSSIQTISVYYVKKAVPSNTQLTEDNIGRTTVIKSLTKTYKTLVTNLSQIKDKSGAFYYVNYDHSLTEGALLSTDDLIPKADKADEKLYKNLKEGQTIFKINVDLDTTEGNSIAGGNSIDIIIRGKDDQGRIINDTFIENVKVIDVVDNKWSSTAGDESGTPKFVIVAVSKEMWKLLTTATLMTNYQFKLVPFVRAKAFEENSESKIVNDGLRSLIEANSSGY